MSKKPFDLGTVAIKEDTKLACPYCNQPLSLLGRKGLFLFVYECRNDACRVTNVSALAKRQCPKCELPTKLCVCGLAKC